MKLDKLEFAVYGLLSIVFALALYFGLTDEEYYTNVFVVEDGAVEYVTALMLLIVSLLSLFRLVTMRRNKQGLWLFGTFGFFVLFLFGAGEEISWGQRIFQVESGEFFRENNAQAETNVHNLVVDGTKINKLIFGQLLTLIIMLYLIVSPMLYRKAIWFKNLANRFAVPIVHWHHTIAFLICTGIVLLIPSPKKWEVYELAIGVVFFLIFINPLNAQSFKDNLSSK